MEQEKRAFEIGKGAKSPKSPSLTPIPFSGFKHPQRCKRGRFYGWSRKPVKDKQGQNCYLAVVIEKMSTDDGAGLFHNVCAKSGAFHAIEDAMKQARKWFRDSETRRPKDEEKDKVYRATIWATPPYISEVAIAQQKAPCVPVPTVPIAPGQVSAIRVPLLSDESADPKRIPQVSLFSRFLNVRRAALDLLLARVRA